MTRIDFYVLSDTDEAQRLDVVCKLAEKALRQSKRVFIHTECSTLAASLDSALWDYRDDSFLPHCTLDSDENTMEPIAIGGACKQPDSARSVLINLGDDVPPFFSRFERTLEIVNQREDVRDNGRKRYSYYQQRGYPLSHHKMKVE